MKEKGWAEGLREALHNQSYQSLFLDSHPDDGIHADARWEQTLGSACARAGAWSCCAPGSPHPGASPWRTMAREQRQAGFHARDPARRQWSASSRTRPRSSAWPAPCCWSTMTNSQSAVVT